MSEHDKHAQDDAELADFADLLRTIRAGDDIEPVDPLPTVWASIEEQIGSAATGSVLDLGAARDRRAQFGKRSAILVAVAAALLLVAVPVGLALRGGADEVQLASAELLILDGAAVAVPANAGLISKDGDDLGIQLETDPITTNGTDFAELWLLRVDDTGAVVETVSLGEATGSGWYDVEDTLDLEATWLVDVSIEPDDDDNAHSGHSVLRGGLA